MNEDLKLIAQTCLQTKAMCEVLLMERASTIAHQTGQSRDIVQGQLFESAEEVLRRYRKDPKYSRAF